jgi:hypothetical protein
MTKMIALTWAKTGPMITILSLNPKRITTHGAYMATNTDIDAKIYHLMESYGFTRWEAMEYLYYEPHDPLDWLNTQWEEPCSLPPY